jgi:HAD superfamily hydrolase (TIGR01509 family)
MPHSKKLVALDIMDTLIYDPWSEALEAATGVTIADIKQREDMSVWQNLERSAIDEAAYWQALERQGIPADPAAFHRVRRQGYYWLPGAQQLLCDLVAGDHHVALATNYPVWIEELYQDLFAEYDIPLYASYKLGVRKPSPDFFASMLRAHGATFADLALVDDNPANVASVAQAGGHGILHTNSARTRTTLQELGVLS